MLPLPPYPPGSLKRVGGRKTGGVLGALAVNLASAAVKWASFYPSLSVFLNELHLSVTVAVPTSRLRRLPNTLPPERLAGHSGRNFNHSTLSSSHVKRMVKRLQNLVERFTGKPSQPLLHFLNEG